MRLRLTSLLVGAIALAGCTQWNMARVAGNGGGGAGGGGTLSFDTGLPCDVNQVLADNCRSCHGAFPSGGAPMSLVTYADLMAPAKSDPSKRVADLCLSRMQSAASPMPPAPTSMPAADVATFQAWLAAGTPMGSCRSGPDPLSAAPTCTSGQYWQGDEGSRMDPGRACISCHSQSREAPRFTLAGTVFPTGHEPDNCLAPASQMAGAAVLITDANGNTLPALSVNSSGNFYYEGPLALPYTAKVVTAGGTRAMSTPQTVGDCNSCHTQSGANGAPGRITLP